QRNSDLAAISTDLSNVLSNTNMPIAIVGRDLRLRRFTPALDRVMKVIPTDVGRPLGDIKLCFALPDLGAIITNAVATLSVSEYEICDDDGRWWALTIRPYQAPDHRVDGAVLVFSDIDVSKRQSERTGVFHEERRLLLAASIDARRSAEEAQHVAEGARVVAETANRAKAEFLSSMSHDLRTPLNAISGYADLMELGMRGPVNEAQLLDLSRIKRSSRHLLALINDILNYAKVEAGSLSFVLSDVRIADAVSELLEMVAPQLAAKSLTFEAGTLVGTVIADSERLQQILLNLVSNAIKFTQPFGRIRITSAVVRDTIRIEVSDTGLGIAASQLNEIFDPFVQINRESTKSATDGVGLGLAISRGLARGMSGDLTATSKSGFGSSFLLTLPANGTHAAPNF
ncbi:MAG: ATP-binding protein, partial [Gemmatimonadaceae bacterium]